MLHRQQIELNIWPQKTRNLQLIYFRDVWFATFLVQFDTFIEFGLNVSDCSHEILPNAYVTFRNFTPDLQKFTQINLSYLWHFATLHHTVKMSRESDPDEDSNEDADYWEIYDRGYDQGNIIIIIVNDNNIIIIL